MHPDQPNAGQPTGNSYDFIVNPQAAPKKTLIPQLGGGTSFTKKLIFIGSGAVILIILMWIVGSLLSGGGVNKADVLTLAQYQQEIARVAEKGEESTDQATKNLAMSTKLSMQTQQKEWLEFLSERGVSVDPKELDLKKNESTDKKLDAAQADNTYDRTFKEIMETYLNDYLQQLDTNFAKAVSEAQKTLLKTHYDQTKLLVEQLPKN